MDAGLIKLVIVVVLIFVGYFRGRKNERQHLKELAEREQALSDVLVFSARYPPMDGRVLDPHLVGGSCVVAADHFKMFVAGLRKFIGGRFSAYEVLAQRARREAVLRMKEQARSAGCRMIFNVRIESTHITTGKEGTAAAVEAFAYGTAFAPAVGTVEESALHYAGVPVPPDEKEFSAFGHPTTRWIFIAWVVVAVWGVGELLNEDGYWYVAPPPWIAFGAIALLAMVAGPWLLRRRGVPLGSAIVFCTVLGVTVPFLLYMPALRINAWTDRSPFKEHIYRVEADRSLKPIETGLPVLRFPEYPEFFAAQPVGAELGFVVRRGWLGFWQVQRGNFMRSVRTWYAAHPDGR